MMRRFAGTGTALSGPRRLERAIAIQAEVIAIAIPVRHFPTLRGGPPRRSRYTALALTANS